MTNTVKFTAGVTATMSKAEQELIKNPTRLDPIESQKEVTAVVRVLRHSERPTSQGVLYSVLFACNDPGLIPNDMLVLYVKDEDALNAYPIGGTYTAVVTTAPGAPVVIVSLAPKVG